MTTEVNDTNSAEAKAYEEMGNDPEFIAESKAQRRRMEARRRGSETLRKLTLEEMDAVYDTVQARPAGASEDWEPDASELKLHQAINHRPLSNEDRSGKRYDLDEQGNQIPGVWTVYRSTGRSYEFSYDHYVAAYSSYEEALEYCNAYNAADLAAKGIVVDSDERTSVGLKFIPLGKPNPRMYTVYTVETVRSEDGTVREIYSVEASIYTSDSIMKFVNEDETAEESRMDNCIAQMMLQPEKAFFIKSYMSEVDVPSGASSDFFPEVGLDNEAYRYEYFRTLDPSNVVLEMP